METSIEQERCPVCGTLKALDRVQCPCGYSFASGFVEPLGEAETAPRTASLLASTRSQDGATAERAGSLAVGILLGFLCGCCALVFALPPETRRGVWIGFVASTFLAVLFEIVYGRH